MRQCFVSVDESLNVLLHILHMYGRSPGDTQISTSHFVAHIPLYWPDVDNSLINVYIGRQIYETVEQLSI